VNLIPLNPTGGYAGEPTGATAAARFVETLERAGIPATIRVRRGIDIDAGCGQLKSKVLRRG
jgi:23S rRNA (adenine2503-C2)-methyltransferase